MCTVCGCGHDNVQIEGDTGPHSVATSSAGQTGAQSSASAQAHSHSHGHSHSHSHNHSQSHSHSHPHDHSHDQQGGHLHHYGQGPAQAHAPGLSQARMVQIEQDVLAKNNTYANANRQRLAQQGILAINLLSSPGSGKTSLLVKSIEGLKTDFDVAVIEGDQQTSNDADRIRATGVPALQINTGKGCHLDGHMVGHALENLKPQEGSLLFIENVGNLVCPALFDLGEAYKVVILSVTEGEDKPLKYPEMFRVADLVLLNKVDLLPHLDFDLEACLDNIHRIRPGIKVLQVSARSGEGINGWLQWLTAAQQLMQVGR